EEAWAGGNRMKASAWKWLTALLFSALPGLASATTRTWVAYENQSFTVNGTQTVRYGVEGHWVTKTVSGTVPCTNDYFASDPPTTWTFAAWENQSFTVEGTQTVRCGVDTRWMVETVCGTVQCTNTYVGRDAAFGVGKHCEVGSSGPANQPPVATISSPASGQT